MSVEIVSHGRTVAKIIASKDDSSAKEAARLVLLARLKGQDAQGSRDWSRSELYDR